MNTKNNHQQIWQVVGSIPKGKVANYGQIAEQAGLKGKARLVGYILSRLPKDTELPWHRVINSQGRLSFPIGSSAYQKQKDRLQAEGIVFIGERISMTTYQWKP